MKRVVFFGSIGLAKRCLEEIIMKENIELVGVCCDAIKSKWREEESVFEFCKRKEIPILSFEDVEKESPDIGFSVRYNKLIPGKTIDAFKLGIFNTHGGTLPEYRGSYCNINALINNEEEYGVTMHYIVEEIDAGDIVAIKKIKISSDDTGFTLYKKSEVLCYQILKENIRSTLDGTNKRISQKSLIKKGHFAKTYFSKQTLEKKAIQSKNLSLNLNIIKAFDSPYHEPAYIMMNDEKIYLRTTY